MNTEYNFVKEINTAQLLDEMKTALLPVPFRIDTAGSDIKIFFTDGLTNDQEATLNITITNHIANPYYVNLINQQKINTLLSYLNNSDINIANIARAVIVANIAPKMPSGLVDMINTQISLKIGS